MPAFFLLDSETKPDRQKGVNLVNFIYAAQANGAQTNVADKLLDCATWLIVWSAVEEISRYATEKRVGEVFPAERVERAVDVGMRCVFFQRGKAVVGTTAAHAIRCIDDDLAVKLFGIFGDDCIHCSARYGQHDDVRLALQRFIDGTDLNSVSQFGA